VAVTRLAADSYSDLFPAVMPITVLSGTWNWGLHLQYSGRGSELRIRTQRLAINRQGTPEPGLWLHLVWRWVLPGSRQQPGSGGQWKAIQLQHKCRPVLSFHLFL